MLSPKQTVTGACNWLIILVGPEGLEPSTNGLWVQWSNGRAYKYQSRTHTDPTRMWLIVTWMDWSGQIPVTFWSHWSSRKRNPISAVPSIRDFSGTIHYPVESIEGPTHIRTENLERKVYYKHSTNTVNFFALLKRSSVSIVVLQKYFHLETCPPSRRNT